MRVAKIERALMIAELELDGLKTHTTMKKEKCRIYNTVFDKKIRRALSAVRSARDILRFDVGEKQMTITTRGGSNRHGRWDANPRSSFTQFPCGFDIDDKEPGKGLASKCWHCGNVFIKTKLCPVCKLYICPSCHGCGCQLSDEARKAVYCALKTLSPQTTLLE